MADGDPLDGAEAEGAGGTGVAAVGPGFVAGAGGGVAGGELGGEAFVVGAGGGEDVGDDDGPVDVGVCGITGTLREHIGQSRPTYGVAFPVYGFGVEKRIKLARQVLPLFVATVSATLAIFFALGAFNPLPVEQRIGRLIWAAAISMGLWATLILALVDSTMGSVNVALKGSLEAMSQPPDFGIPFMRPQRVSAEDWTQPEREDGDRLIEGSQLDRDGEVRPIVLLVKPNGEIHGYSRALDGLGIDLQLENQRRDMPPDPGEQ